MTRMTMRGRLSGWLAVAAVMAAAWAWADGPGWHVGLGGGQVNYEGDEPVEDSALITATVGYDQNSLLSWEAALEYAPEVDANYRTEWSTGERINRLAEESGEDLDSTSSLRFGLDALLHVLGDSRVDPFLAAGAGLVWYEDDFGSSMEPLVRAGGGVMLHLNETWALRADVRPLFAGSDTEANAIYTAGLVWKSPRPAAKPAEGSAAGAPAAGAPAAGKPSERPAAAKPAEPDPRTRDTDADGIPDLEEEARGTSPLSADTDKDKLQDKAEIETHRTDPLKEDSDFDGLSDGDEINRYKTDPLKRDSDEGGVADGHEALEDSTNPLQREDDLVLFELQMTFANDGWEIGEEYFTELDAIARVILSDPKSSARIEGHTDRRPGSEEKAENRLTLRRARAIQDYFADKCKIPGSRLDSAGYGFSRPKAANDPATGNAANRRMEIYVRLPGGKKAAGQ